MEARPRPGTAPDALAIFESTDPWRLPDRLVDEVAKATGCRVALCVIDLEGRCLRVVSSRWEGLGDGIALEHAVGPEIASSHFPSMQAAVQAAVGPATCLPLRLRGRAIAVLIADGDLEGDEGADLLRNAAAAVELSIGYTDRFASARRARKTSAAAELQEELLPPRLARTDTIELAAALLPAYEVGGDWFDHTQNADGVWMTVADAAGKGPHAAAVSALALGALRSARRSGAALDDAAGEIHAMLASLREFTFVTALLARWDARTQTLGWVVCGHPPPLVVDEDGTTRELEGALGPPLGVGGEDRRFPVNEYRVAVGQRVVLYSDGISERRCSDGTLFGIAGIEAGLRAAHSPSAASALTSLLRTVVDASPEPLRDDATVLVVRRVA